MSLTVCLGTSNTLRYPQGGHLWVFINWAAGFRANGCRIVWLDVIDLNATPEALRERITTLKSRIGPFGLADTIALVAPDGTPVPGEHDTGCMGIEDATSADLLFDLRYNFPESLVCRFRRSAMLDIDPGILQIASNPTTPRTAPPSVVSSKSTSTPLRWPRRSSTVVSDRAFGYWYLAMKYIVPHIYCE